MEHRTRYPLIVLGVLIVALSAFLVYGYTVHKSLKAQHAGLQTEFENYKQNLTEKQEQVLNLEAMIDILKQEASLSEESRTELTALLEEERGRNETFEDKINSISGTVGKLEKLSQTDPELLMKYSKIYFLNEHYAPEKITEIPEEFRFKKDEPEYISGQVWPSLEDLLKDAKEDGINLLVVSGYRSYDEQKGLKSVYSVQYGSGANTFSADQGYSEHQLGTTIDFTTAETGGALIGFQNTDAYAWLVKYGYKYGFVLSYPEKNGYYIFEPWHWRFVGEDLADDLHDDDKFFYDLEQREIDEYLISIFD